MSDTRSNVQRALEVAAPELCATLRSLAGGRRCTVVSVFGLLPYSQWAAAKMLGLAEDGPLIDLDSGTRPLVPTPLAWELISDFGSSLSTSTLLVYRDLVRAALVGQVCDLGPDAQSPRAGDTCGEGGDGEAL
jgi:hypothetical protein